MTTLGLTQRVTVVEEYGERRDCLDQEWTVRCEEWGHSPVVLPNRVDDVPAYLDGLALDGVVLTSGNDLAHLEDAAVPAPERDAFERAVLEWALERSVPVLGVCRGLEFLVDYFGGALTTVEGHVATEHEVTFRAEAVGGLALPDAVTVNSYHDYGVDPADVAGPLRVVATAPDGSVECLAHESAPVWAVMWHPERDSPSADLDRQLFGHLFGDGE